MLEDFHLREKISHFDHERILERAVHAFRQRRELLLEQLPAHHGDTVLKVGCGTGLCHPLLQRQSRAASAHHLHVEQ